jgi:hypothetical protein
VTAYTFDLRLKQSATFIQAFRIGPCNSPVDLTGYTARAHLRLTLDADAYLLELTTDNGGIVIDADARTLTLNISDAQRDELIALDEPRLVYDVFLISPTGRSYPLLAGKVLVERSVTHD